MAARDCHVNTVKYLVEQDADLNIEDGNGVSELENTADCKLVWVIRVLSQSTNNESLVPTVVECIGIFW